MATHSKHSVPRGLSLYANLLDPSSRKDIASGTISRAPVAFKQPDVEEGPLDPVVEDKQQHTSAASLRFQPTKRPQLPAQKAKPKTSALKPTAPPHSSRLNSLDNLNIAAKPRARNTLPDWTLETDENDVNNSHGPEKRQRGGKKRRRKIREESTVLQNWDDIYDPSRPNTYEDYKYSDERIMEIREWKDKLYAHRIARRRGSDSDSSEDRDKIEPKEQMPSASLSFAPPPTFDDGDEPRNIIQVANMPDNATGEDAYARRIRLSGISKEIPPTQSTTVPDKLGRTVAPSQAKTSLAKPSDSIPSISRAPVRYNLPLAPSEIPKSEAELESALQKEATGEEPSTAAAPRSLRPGQKGFAERLMSKYGWSKGSGLGVSGSGIVNPLRVQVEKQKRKPDSEGGLIGPGGMGKILGGKKKHESTKGKFGTMSEVIVLSGMVDGMDLDAEMESSTQGGLMQEIGEECGEKYGRVERVFIDKNDVSHGKVFVKFTSQLSALRAVNALEGRIFNGNTIGAKFFDPGKFESGLYE